MLSGYIASFLFILCLTSGIYLFGYAARNASALYITILEVFVGTLLILPILLFREGLSFTELFTKPIWQNWLWLGIASICGFVGGNYFSLINLRTTGETRNSLLSPAITASVVLGTVLFFKEKISLINGTGIIITLGSIIYFLLLSPRQNEKIKEFNKAIWSGFATLLCITLFVLFSIQGAKSGQLSIFHTIWLRMLIALPIVTILFITIKHKRPKIKGSKPLFYTAIAAAILIQTIAGNYLWFYATFHIGTSVFQTIIATLPLWVYATEIFILKRSIPSYRFLFTAFLASLGIALLMW